VSPAGFQISTAAAGERDVMPSGSGGKTGYPLQDLWSDCRYKRLCAQISSIEKANVM